MVIKFEIIVKRAYQIDPEIPVDIVHNIPDLADILGILKAAGENGYAFQRIG